MITETHLLNGCIPVKLISFAEEFLCQWFDAGDEIFSDPFFDDTLMRLRGLQKATPGYRSCSTPNMIVQWGEALKPVRPAAVIFHVSRCGSTLLSQLLSLQGRFTSLSEVPFFDELLRAHHRGELKEELPALLKKSVDWYGQNRGEGLFIKADSWHLFFYDSYRAAWPDVPFVFLYRSPGEVIRSQQKRRGMQSVPGVVEPSVFGFTTEDAACTNLDLYMAKVLEKYFEKMIALAAVDPHILLADYKDGFLSLSKNILANAGITLAAADEQFLQDRCQYHGKYPGQTFVKEEEPVPDAPYLDKAQQLYAVLEEIRKRSGRI